MSSRLKTIRKLLNDPVLVRTSEGMQPTKRVLQLKPVVRQMIRTIEETLVVTESYDSKSSDRVFKIMASDYTASILLPALMDEIRKQAPNLSIDIITPSDTTFHDIENGQVDIAINQFTHEPSSFHQQLLWEDKFCVVMRTDNLKKTFTLNDYMNSQHLWVSNSDYGTGISHDESPKFTDVDCAIRKLGKQRDIKLFTRSYHVALQLAQEHNLVVTLPYRAALLKKHNPELTILPLPFEMEPFELKMIWCPLLHKDGGHRWLRKLIKKITAQN